MIDTAVYDTKPYDREYLARAASAERIAWRFHDFRLSAETASAAKDAQAVCIFVNDRADRACLDEISHLLIFPNVLIPRTKRSRPERHSTKSLA